MNEKEIEFKTLMWMKVNADYLKEKAEKEERERVEREEAERDGKPIKKKTQYKKKAKMEKGHNQTAIEGKLKSNISKNDFSISTKAKRCHMEISETWFARLRALILRCQVYI